MSEPTREESGDRTEADDTSPAFDPEKLVRRVFLLTLLLVGVGHTGFGLARGTLQPTLFGIAFAPVLIAGTVTLVLMLALDLRAKRYGQVALGLLISVVIGAPILSGGLARAMMFPGNPEPLPDSPAVVTYTTADGITLRGALIGAASAADVGSRAVLVYFHGNAESAAHNLQTGRDFARAGCVVFVAEYRGYGGCPGSPNESGLLEDGRAALAEVERRLGVKPQDVVLVGRSLGTGVAAGLAGQGYGRAVVLLSPYTSMVDMATAMVPAQLAWLAVRDRFDSLAALSATQHRVLVIHGTQDGVIPFALGKKLATALGERARLVALEGVGHNDLFHRAGERVVRETASFLR